MGRLLSFIIIILWALQPASAFPLQPDSLSLNKPVEPVIKRVFTADGNLLFNWTDPGASVSNPDIPFSENHLIFEFGNAQFISGTQYQTQMDGLDDNWSYWSSAEAKDYVNLPGGHYTFQLRTKSVNGEISPVISYAFSISAPWYEAWWVYIVIGFIVLVVAYGLSIVAINRYKRQAAKLEETISSQSAEMKQRVEEIEVINSVQEALVSSIDMHAIYNLVGDKIRKIFNAQSVMVSIFDHETKTENIVYNFEKGKKHKPDPRPIDMVRRHLIDKREAILIRENFLDAVVKEFGIDKPKPVPGTEMPKAAIWVPLIVNDVVKGYVSIQNVDREFAFDEADVRLLSTLANGMSAALENARLLSETEQRNAELAVINSVQEGLAAELDLKGIYELVGERIRVLFDAQVTTINSFDREADLEFFEYMYEDGERYTPNSRPLNKLRQHLIKTKKMLVINEELEDTVFKITGEKAEPVPGTKSPKSIVFVPLIIADEVVGCVTLQNLDRQHAFSESDIRLMATLANSMTVALQNARLFNETEQRNAELAVINSVQQGLVAEMDLQGIYDLVGDRIQRLFDAQVVEIATFNHENKTEQFHYYLEEGRRHWPEPRPYDQIREDLITRKENIVVNKDVDNLYPGDPIEGTKNPKSMIFIPMILGETVRGYVSLQNLDHENAFPESDVRLLATLANSMTVALENARLFDETNRLLLETEQRNAELAVINSVQQGLVAEMDLQSIYDLVGERIRELFDAQVVGIATFDHDKNYEHFKYVFEDGERLKDIPSRPFDYIRKTLIETKKNFVVNEDLAAIIPDPPVAGTRKPQSMVFVPLVLGDLVKGYVSLQNLDRQNAFSKSDIRLLSTLANSMIVALENARLFDETNRLLHETEQRNAELAVINSVQQGLVAEMDLKGIYNLVGERIRDMFDSQVTAIITFDADFQQEHFEYVFEDGVRLFPDSRSLDPLRKKIISDKKFLLINKDAAREMSEINGKPFKPVKGTRMAQSALYVPMVVGDKVKGYVTLQNLDREDAFSESDVRLLTTLANSMSVALENARLFDETNRLLHETEQRNAELGVINSVQEGLVAQMEMKAIYDLVGDKIRDIFDAQVLVIRTYDLDNSMEYFQYVIEKGKRFYPEPRPIDRFQKSLIKRIEPVLINEKFVDELQKYTDEIVVEGEAPKSALYVPLVVGDKVVGNVSLQNVDHEHAFNESDVRLLSTLANSMSVALENARLFDETHRLLQETEQRNAELAVINSIQQGLVAEMDLQGIYDLVGDRIRELFDAQVVAIATFNHTDKTEKFHYLFEDGERFTDIPARSFDRIRVELIETRKNIVVNEQLLEKYPGPPVEGTRDPKSMVFVPLILGDAVRGYVTLQNLDHEHAFPESDVRLLSTLANSMTVALENARLFDETNRLLNETKQRNAELGVINNVQDGLVRELDLDGIYELVGNKIYELFETQSVLIRTFSQAENLEYWEYVNDKGERLKSEPREIIWANRQLIKFPEPIVINEDYVETAKKYGGTGVSIGKPPKSAVFVPIIIGEKVMGSISLQNTDKEHVFSESEVRLLTTLANSMSVAIENARLFTEINQRATEMATVNDISNALVSQLEIDALIHHVGEKMRETFDADIVYVALLDKNSKMINFPYAYGDTLSPIPFGEGLTSRIIQTGEPLLINREMDRIEENLGVKILGIPSTSYLGVPISLGGENVGVISVQSTTQQNRFNEADVRLLSTIAANVGVALHNATLFEENQEARALAEEANEAKSAFLSTVSHELRTPLTSVLGFAKIIKKRLDEKIFPLIQTEDVKIKRTINQVAENLQVVLAEGERLTTLINNVLDLAKIEAGKIEWHMERMSPASMIERALAATTSLFENSGLKLINKINKNLPDILGDEDKLIQVLINLISNAVKFTQKGSVTVSARVVEDDILVSVTDTGTGISDEDQPKVFEKFKQVGDTLTDKPQGTGLGLTICKEIVEYHTGKIWVKSQLGKGSTFYFTIPLHAKIDAGREISPMDLSDLLSRLKERIETTTPKPLSEEPRVLVVDDDANIRELLQQELTEGGYKVQSVDNGRDALDLIRTQHPDLVILDVMMPEMNGFDVAAVLKNDPETMDIPIIILSIVKDMERGYRLGVDRYLTKPIDTDKLFKEVDALLLQRKSKKKVMVVDEDASTIKTMVDVLQARGYSVVEANGKELMEKAIAEKPDIIFMNSLMDDNQEVVKSLRFEKGMENVLFLVYQ